MIQLTNNDFNTHIFAYLESDWLEFKQTINSCSINKIIETICAFLNRNGGYIIFGIDDERKIIGINNKSKEIDTFKLKLDDHIRSNSIVYNNNKNIQEPYMSIENIFNNLKKTFILIRIFPKNNFKYKLKSGLIVNRLNASNITMTIADNKHQCTTYINSLKEDNDKYKKKIISLNSLVEQVKNMLFQKINNLRLEKIDYKNKFDKLTIESNNDKQNDYKNKFDKLIIESTNDKKYIAHGHKIGLSICIGYFIIFIFKRLK